MMRKLQKIALATALATFGMQSGFSENTKPTTYKTNPLELYSEVTSLTMAFNSKYGKKASIPTNSQGSIPLILANSDTKKFMGSKDYNGYSKNSQFSKRSSAMMEDLETLIGKFKQIGFIDEIKSQGKTPAIMFDIDNTIELTSFEDDINTKSGINDPATAKFIKKVCFKNGVDCYFITARSCNNAEATNTKTWLQKHLGLTDKQISKYVFLSGSVPGNACTTDANNKVAYKDAFRRALSEQRNVYWLMSIGDQMTDWFGKHSGLKVWYPNEMFDSSIVENTYYKKDGKKHLKIVTAPSDKCYAKLKDHVLKESTIQYCSTFKDDKYISS
tara:strand:- start:958 stop:1947 length:990 start_codon:yes stop_codon:yes gene_type:complete